MSSADHHRHQREGRAVTVVACVALALAALQTLFVARVHYLSEAVDPSNGMLGLGILYTFPMVAFALWVWIGLWSKHRGRSPWWWGLAVLLGVVGAAASVWLGALVGSLFV